MAKGKKSKIVIEGITDEGKAFRPSDWAERISGQLSTFKNHRVLYSPLLKPTHKEGKRCLVIDTELKITNPDLFAQIIDFATINKLKICPEEDNGENHGK